MDEFRAKARAVAAAESTAKDIGEIKATIGDLVSKVDRLLAAVEGEAAEQAPASRKHKGA